MQGSPAPEGRENRPDTAKNGHQCPTDLITRENTHNFNKEVKQQGKVGISCVSHINSDLVNFVVRLSFFNIDSARVSIGTD